MDNTRILTAGSRISAKKRKQRKEQVQEIAFSDSARREFLTGFEKRKKERKQQAKNKALERERLERIEERKMRKEAREERTQQLQQEYHEYAKSMYRHEHGHEPEADDGEGELGEETTTAQAGDASPDDDDVWRTDVERDQPAAATHYAGATSATTVTVITDFDQDIELDKAARESVDARAKAAVKREQDEETTKIQRALEALEKPKKRPTKKFRYVTKAENNADRAKQAAQKAKQQAKRRK